MTKLLVMTVILGWMFSALATNDDKNDSTLEETVHEESVYISNVSMAQISLDVSADFSLPFSDEIEMDVWFTEPGKVADKLKQWSGVNVLAVSQNTLSISLSRKPVYKGPVLAQHLQDSFVIDFKEQSTRQFISEFEAQANDDWKLPVLTEFVSGYIEDTTYIHGFNIASVVASQKSGDCTEYAALTTALSRAKGLPARYITGTVIVAESDEVYAFGHAWTEVFVDDKWQIIDAALYNVNAENRFYLPGTALENEGMGYGLSFIEAIAFLPSKITGLKKAD